MTPKKELVAPDTLTSLEGSIEIRRGGTARKAHVTNPFISSDKFSLHIERRSEVVARNLSVVDKKQNQIADGAVIRYKYVDPEKFIKLYGANIGKFFDISKTAQRTIKVVLCAVQEQSRNKTEIFLTYQESLKYFSLLEEKAQSKSSFSRGISELIESDFIAISKRGIGWYWINPNIVFNGSRVAFMELVIAQRSQELEENNEYKQDIQ